MTSCLWLYDSIPFNFLIFFFNKISKSREVLKISKIHMICSPNRDVIPQVIFSFCIFSQTVKHEIDQKYFFPIIESEFIRKNILFRWSSSSSLLLTLLIFFFLKRKKVVYVLCIRVAMEWNLWAEHNICDLNWQIWHQSAVARCAKHAQSIPIVINFIMP